MVLKSRTLAAKQQERAAGDYSVSVDRSGMSSHVIRHLELDTMSLGSVPFDGSSA